jgi:ketosteroid isomerase-like protein
MEVVMVQKETVKSLSIRLKKLEDEKRVSACMNRYMYLCDELDEGADLDELMDLFTEDAVWEGKGRRYAGTFGRHEGKGAIRAMFAKYTQPPSHFDLNVHFLTSELVEVINDSASASWVLLQTSSFTTGKSQLSSARLRVTFRCEKGLWHIQTFQTESLFNRPVATPWDQPTELPLPK